MEPIVPTAEPRPAATVILARPGPDSGIEVLALRRSRESPFVPGFVVFPGGSVEPSDDALAQRWFGTQDERARACAVRELAEESGVSLTGAGAVAATNGPRGLDVVAGAPPRVDQLPEIGRWIAPPFLAVRFDARFFVAASDRCVEPTPDGREVDAAWWARPADLLERYRGGRIALAWPTRATLEALAACATVERALALHVEQIPPPADRADAEPPSTGVVP